MTAVWVGPQAVRLCCQQEFEELNVMRWKEISLTNDTA